MTIEYKQTVLENGLTIAAEVDDSAHSAAIGFFVKTGARDEEASVMGVSHFLEHMMFKGTETRRAEDVDRGFDDLGAEHNAFTTSEMTAFHAHSLPEQLGAATEILADIMRPSIRVKDFDDEKSVILEEIAMYADNPFWVLYERAMEEYYGAHPLGHRVLGTNDTVTNMQRDAMKAYFDHRYSADNTVVALAGKVDFEGMVEQLRTCCGSWNTTNAVRVYPDSLGDVREFTLEKETVHQHYLLMIAPAPGVTDERRYAAGMLAAVLGDSEGSRLYWALVDPGLAEEAVVQHDGRDGQGEYLIYAACDPRNSEEVEKKVQEEMASVIDTITEDDLVRVRNKVLTAATLHGELPAGRMRRLGQVLTYQGEYRSLEDELGRMNAVTLEEMRGVHEAFPFVPRVVGRMRPEGEA